MLLFRSIWLKRILILLLAILLSADHFCFTKQQWEETNKVVISSPQCLAQLTSIIQQAPIKYKHDVIQILISPDLVKRDSTNYIPETSFKYFSAALIETSDRGPPRNITIL